MKEKFRQILLSKIEIKHASDPLFASEEFADEMQKIGAVIGEHVGLTDEEQRALTFDIVEDLKGSKLSANIAKIRNCHVAERGKFRVWLGELFSGGRVRVEE